MIASKPLQRYIFFNQSNTYLKNFFYCSHSLKLIEENNNYQWTCITDRTANNPSRTGLSSIKHKGSNGINAADTILSSFHKFTWSPCVLWDLVWIKLLAIIFVNCKTSINYFWKWQCYATYKNTIISINLVWSWMKWIFESYWLR